MLRRGLCRQTPRRFCDRGSIYVEQFIGPHTRSESVAWVVALCIYKVRQIAYDTVIDLALHRDSTDPDLGMRRLILSAADKLTELDRNERQARNATLIGLQDFDSETLW